MVTKITEPRVGAVFVFLPPARSGTTRTRYIITEAQRRGMDEWCLDLVDVQQRKLILKHRYIPSMHNVEFEPLADGEEVLFMQAMLAPHTLKEKLP